MRSSIQNFFFFFKLYFYINLFLLFTREVYNYCLFFNNVVRCYSFHCPQGVDYILKSLGCLECVLRYFILCVYFMTFMSNRYQIICKVIQIRNITVNRGQGVVSLTRVWKCLHMCAKFSVHETFCYFLAMLGQRHIYLKKINSNSQSQSLKQATVSGVLFRYFDLVFGFQFLQRCVWLTAHQIRAGDQNLGNDK